MKQLIHNGVLVPEKPNVDELYIYIHERQHKLTPKQAEMALAWAKKEGTPYVEDHVFIRNFMEDFSKALDWGKTLSIEEVDFGPVIQLVLSEREARANMIKEQRKELAAQRKAKREELRQKYGQAVVDGEETELANYIVEPSGIFMGRGKHPLRGRWKEGANENDITLNLSPDAPIPSGNWHEIIWQPEYMWVARWTDKLSGKIKYVWLHDSSPIKQAREASKFDKAHELHAKLLEVRAQIEKDLSDENPRQWEIATACYLIDALGLRVGDEKDPDEADTVGATTLRPEHVKLHPNGMVEFKFLGKDSVQWHKKIALPEKVQWNLVELAQNARPSGSRKNKKNHPTKTKPQLFPGIDSRDVNAYLSNIMPGLTAKVFRTHHATKVVEQTLESALVKATDPEYIKWETTVKANLEAAKLCNHTKMPPKNLKQRKQRYQERLERAKTRVQKYRDEIKHGKKKLGLLREEQKKKIITAKTAKRRKQIRTSYIKKIARQKNLVDKVTTRLQQAQAALTKLKIQSEFATKHYNWNLTTSQKSYIDPRVYYHWGQRVDYDVLGKYYSKTLQQKFAWVRADDETKQGEK